jgi:putative flippase GtrA
MFMTKIKNLFEKYKSVISYLFFGVCTTVVNIVIYYISYNLLNISNVLSTIIAWIVSVIFAFITNKWFVFESKTLDLKVLGYEFASFIGCRILTGVIDVAIMYVAVDCFMWNGVIWKIISNIIVVILNYVASKLIIFKKQ